MGPTLKKGPTLHMLIVPKAVLIGHLKGPTLHLLIVLNAVLIVHLTIVHLHCTKRSTAALMMAHHMHKLSKSRFEREDFGLKGGAGIPNPGSTQIYLTFAADSTFKEEDVSNYFSYYWFQKFNGPRVRVSKRVKGDDGQRVRSRNIGILMMKSIQLLKILKNRRIAAQYIENTVSYSLGEKKGIELVGREVTVELKNDLAIQRTLHSLDQYLNIKLQNTKIVDEDNYPHIEIETLALNS
ncbi:hypothetical protein H5410_064224 [Solanum commersonii]|uniref:Sm domain-containing protein n=1 Tax=Solanum commersonii TaxID=4109 RepID=A0A9J5W046_SOLCO|nr:hypothetical protein H5410_064224 [Solanum commersonii]